METIRAGVRALAPIVAPTVVAWIGAWYMSGHMGAGIVGASAFALLVVLPAYAFAWIGLSLGGAGFVAPPGLPMIVATLVALLPIAVATSSPWGDDSLLWLYGGLAAWSIVGAWWLVKLGFAWAHDGPGIVRRRLPRWALVFALGVAGFLATVSPLPLRAAFEMNRGAMEGAAARVHAGQLGVGVRVSLGTWSGEVETPVSGAEASFYLGSTATDFIGIAEFPTDVTPADGDYYTWQQIDGRWWLWHELMSR